MLNLATLQGRQLSFLEFAYPEDQTLVGARRNKKLERQAAHRRDIRRLPPLGGRNAHHGRQPFPPRCRRVPRVIHYGHRPHRHHQRERVLHAPLPGRHPGRGSEAPVRGVVTAGASAVGRPPGARPSVPGDPARKRPRGATSSATEMVRRPVQRSRLFLHSRDHRIRRRRHAPARRTDHPSQRPA